MAQKLNATELAAFIAGTQEVSPDWEVFGAPEVVVAGGHEMVRVMLRDPEAPEDSEDDQTWFLVMHGDASENLPMGDHRLYELWRPPAGPWTGADQKTIASRGTLVRLFKYLPDLAGYGVSQP
jgi:hypothetical protein